MPYIPREARTRLEEKLDVRGIGKELQSAGELNYIITTIIDDYVKSFGEPTYGLYNSVIGVLECSKLELYRRLVAPYENIKQALNGEVYSK